MKDKIRKMVSSGDMEMVELGIHLLMSNFPVDEWADIIPITKGGLGGHRVKTVYILKKHIMVLYDSPHIRLVLRTENLVELYKNYFNDKETYNIIYL